MTNVEDDRTVVDVTPPDGKSLNRERGDRRRNGLLPLSQDVAPFPGAIEPEEEAWFGAMERRIEAMAPRRNEPDSTAAW